MSNWPAGPSRRTIRFLRRGTNDIVDLPSTWFIPREIHPNGVLSPPRCAGSTRSHAAPRKGMSPTSSPLARYFGQFLREQNDPDRGGRGDHRALSLDVMPVISRTSPRRRDANAGPASAATLQHFPLSRALRESTYVITGGGNRTHTGVTAQRILSPQRLPQARHRGHVGLALEFVAGEPVESSSIQSQIEAALG